MNTRKNEVNPKIRTLLWKLERIKIFLVCYSIPDGYGEFPFFFTLKAQFYQQGKFVAKSERQETCFVSTHYTFDGASYWNIQTLVWQLVIWTIPYIETVNQRVVVRCTSCFMIVQLPCSWLRNISQPLNIRYLQTKE